MKRLRMLLLPLATVCFAIGLAACGSSDSTSSSSSPATSSTEAGSGSSDSASLSAAQQEVEKLAVYPDRLSGITPLKKKPPEGETIAYMQCAVLQCTNVGEELESVAPKLGYQIKKYNTGATPETISAAFDRAVADQPAGVLVPAIPSVLYKKQLKEFEAAEIPVIAWTVPEEPGGGIVQVILPRSQYEETGERMADWVLADSSGEANAVFFNVPDFPSLGVMQESFESQFEKGCPDCEYGAETSPPTAIGKELPGQVVSYVQAHPNTSYVVLAFGSMVLGVPEALKAAGLSEQVKIVSQAGLNLNFEYIEKGEQAVDLTLSHLALSYAALDSMARVNTGQSLEGLPTHVPSIFLTEENLDFDPKTNTTAPMPKSWEEQYEEAWAGR